MIASAVILAIAIPNRNSNDLLCLSEGISWLCTTIRMISWDLRPTISPVNTRLQARVELSAQPGNMRKSDFVDYP